MFLLHNDTCSAVVLLNNVTWKVEFTPDGWNLAFNETLYNAVNISSFGCNILLYFLTLINNFDEEGLVGFGFAVGIALLTCFGDCSNIFYGTSEFSDGNNQDDPLDFPSEMNVAEEDDLSEVEQLDYQFDRDLTHKETVATLNQQLEHLNNKVNTAGGHTMKQNKTSILKIRDEYQDILVDVSGDHLEVCNSTQALDQLISPHTIYELRSLIAGINISDLDFSALYQQPPDNEIQLYEINEHIRENWFDFLAKINQNNQKKTQ